MRKAVGKEGDLVRAVIQYLNARGAFAWRNQSGMLRGAHKGKPWAVRMGVRGMPDVLAVLPIGPFYVGRLLAVECKRRPNKPTAAQEHTMNQLRKRGALVVVAYSVADVEKALA